MGNSRETCECMKRAEAIMIQTGSSRIERQIRRLKDKWHCNTSRKTTDQNLNLFPESSQSSCSPEASGVCCRGCNLDTMEDAVGTSC
jgi:hypothetical protein